MLASSLSGNYKYSLKEVAIAIGESVLFTEENEIINTQLNLMKELTQREQITRSNIILLMYGHMLGHSITGFFPAALDCLAQSKSFVIRRLGYFIVANLVPSTSGLRIVAVNSILKDLETKINHVVYVALQALSQLLTEEIIPIFESKILVKLTAENPMIRRMAIACYHKICHGNIDHAIKSRSDISKLYTMICDLNPSVMAAVLPLIHEVHKAFLVADIAEKPLWSKTLLPSCVCILSQILDRRLGGAFDYADTPAPFIQISLIQMVSTLKDDITELDQIVIILLRILRNGIKSVNNVGLALIYEAIKSFNILVDPDKFELQWSEVSGLVSRFLNSNAQLVQYTGLKCLQEIAAKVPETVLANQNILIDLLHSKDLTFGGEVLKLLYRIINQSNLKSIVKSTFEYSKSNLFTQHLLNSYTSQLLSAVNSSSSAEITIDLCFEVLAKFVDDYGCTQLIIDTSIISGLLKYKLKNCECEVIQNIFWKCVGFIRNAHCTFSLHKAALEVIRKYWETIKYTETKEENTNIDIALVIRYIAILSLDSIYKDTQIYALNTIINLVDDETLKSPSSVESRILIRFLLDLFHKRDDVYNHRSICLNILQKYVAIYSNRCDEIELETQLIALIKEFLPNQSHKHNRALTVGQTKSSEQLLFEPYINLAVVKLHKESPSIRNPLANKIGADLNNERFTSIYYQKLLLNEDDNVIEKEKGYHVPKCNVSSIPYEDEQSMKPIEIFDFNESVLSNEQNADRSHQSSLFSGLLEK